MATDLQAILQRPIGEKITSLAALVEHESPTDAAITAAVSILEQDQGEPKNRLLLAEALGYAGDPRLSSPSQQEYWTRVQLEDYELDVGRFLVTTQEWLVFLDSGEYKNNAHWSVQGIAWRDAERRTWRDLAASPEAAPLIVPNQPVVGVSWFEAEAYANAHQARLMDFSERVQVVRGQEKRPYPWGAPFRHGHANTKEEALARPCPVGMFVHDKTPEGVCDLAGNVAEWTNDMDQGKRVIHPGSWSHDSMASWAKASNWISAAARLDNLGFRVVRDR